jgi:hypothetical protein
MGREDATRAVRERDLGARDLAVAAFTAELPYGFDQQ